MGLTLPFVSYGGSSIPLPYTPPWVSYPASRPGPSQLAEGPGHPVNRFKEGSILDLSHVTARQRAYFRSGATLPLPARRRAGSNARSGMLRSSCGSF